MAEGRFVAYYRVSTDRQGRSGLGIDAQRKAVTDYLNGGNWDLAAEFTEVESGKSDRNRPELIKALAECRRLKATLVIAKLDRLSRNLAFIAALIESKVEFLAADNPHANKTMIQMLAVFSEHERDMISARTKAALAAAKARGVQLGKQGKINQAQAAQRALQLAETIRSLRSKHQSVRALTEEMNRRAVPTPRGGKWHVTSVHRLLKRLEVQPPNR